VFRNNNEGSPELVAASKNGTNIMRVGNAIQNNYGGVGVGAGSTASGIFSAMELYPGIEIYYISSLFFAAFDFHYETAMVTEDFVEAGYKRVELSVICLLAADSGFFCGCKNFFYTRTGLAVIKLKPGRIFCGAEFFFY
jgi:hypothetical protein